MISLDVVVAAAKRRFLVNSGAPILGIFGELSPLRRRMLSPTRFARKLIAYLRETRHPDKDRSSGSQSTIGRLSTFCGNMNTHQCKVD